MKVRIKIETEFGWGECRSHEIGVIERCSIDPSEDSLGISLAEGKSILKEVQRAYSGASGRSFRRHPATQTGVSGHLWRVVLRPEVSGIRF